MASACLKSLSTVGPINPPAAAFMQRALDLAAATENAGRGNAYGPVIVLSGKIIGEGANVIYAHHDPTAHGVMKPIPPARATALT
ncbi:MAG: hypothetical protein ACKVHX_04725 [Alphaproteobacteria bacterium]